MTRKNDKLISFLVSPAMAKHIDRVAKAKFQTRSHLLREAVANYIFSPPLNDSLNLKAPRAPENTYQIRQMVREIED